MTKISRKYTNLVFGALMGVFMSLIMSLSMTLVNAGLTPSFLALWGRAFLTGLIIGTPASILVSPLVGKIVNKMVK